MFAHITTFQLKPGTTDDLVRIFQDSSALAATEQQGFNGLTLLADPRTAKVIAIDLWATEADLLAGERSGYYQERNARIGDLLAGPPLREVYEVSVQVEMTVQGAARIRGI